MRREINTKFDWQEEAQDYIKETFTNIGMGSAYYGRIVIKSKLIGYDNNNNPVKEYSNKFGTLFLTKTAYNSIVTSNKPQLSVAF